jgi:glycosyltransferase involved in cell wall biosynthesis
VTDPGTPPRRLAVVLSHPTQYYSPWFRWIRAHSGIDLRVFYLWDFGVAETHDPQFGRRFAWDVDLLSGYESEFVPNVSKRPGAEHFLGFRNPGLTARIAAWGPDALLIFGYKYASHLAAIAWARSRSIPLLFRGDSHLLGGRRLGLRARVPLRILYSQFARFLYVGEANRDYFRTLGVPESKLFRCPHCVDAALFDPARQGVAEEAAGLRARLGIGPATRVVLFAGKLLPAKQPAELLEAFLALAPADAALVFVGDGPERERLLRAAEGAAAPVRFLPFANQSEMPARLAMADVFALPSRGLYETWGLAVNEAMHMGVPCLVSDRVGCQRDLVTQGKTGWVFRADDAQGPGRALAEALSDLRSPGRLGAIRQGVRDRIGGYTYAHATEGLLAALASLPRRRMIA